MHSSLTGLFQLRNTQKNLETMTAALAAEKLESAKRESVANGKTKLMEQASAEMQAEFDISKGGTASVKARLRTAEETVALQKEELEKSRAKEGSRNVTYSVCKKCRTNIDDDADDDDKCDLEPSVKTEGKEEAKVVIKEVIKEVIVQAPVGKNNTEELMQKLFTAERELKAVQRQLQNAAKASEAGEEKLKEATKAAELEVEASKASVADLEKKYDLEVYSSVLLAESHCEPH